VAIYRRAHGGDDAMGGNLYHDLCGGFASDPGAPFLRVPEGRTHTFVELEHRAGELAAALVALGTTPGERVVVQVEKSPDAVALYLACLRIGAVFVPLNTAYTEDEVAYTLGDATPAVLVTTPERGESLAALAARSGVPTSVTLGAGGEGSLPQRVVSSRSAPALERDGSALAAMLYTSGTTGRPKGAMLSHDNLRANATTLHALWGFRPGDVLLHALPIFHAHGLFVALHCAMLNGSEVIFLPRFDAGEVRRLLPQATVLMGVPTFYTRLLADPEFGRSDCERVRLFISGSAPLPEAVFQRFAERVGQPILERYGMTEAGMITSNPLEGARIAGSVGFALPDVAVRVVDAAGAALPAGEVGEVEIRGPNVFGGYWQKPDPTREAFRADGFFRTGDLGSLTSDGRLFLVGRSSDLIISGGYNVYPKEIEACLDALPGVAESAVVGIAHPDLGEAVVAFVVRDGELSEASLRPALGERLARFKQPKRTLFVDALPRNAMGKVQKKALREAHADLFAEAAPPE
jgi:malonyl-CoA/methylmalonyl-CoA synthetase